MSVEMVVIAAIATSTPVALYVAARRGAIRRCIGIVRGKLGNFGTGKRYVDGRFEELRAEVANLREHLEKYREKIDALENRLHSLEERVELIDKRLASLDVHQHEEDDTVLKVVELRKKGYSIKKIAEELNIPLSRVRKILKSSTTD